MVRRIIGIVFAASFLPLAAGAQAPAPPAAKKLPRRRKKLRELMCPDLSSS